jgi:hypothetical protein
LEKFENLISLWAGPINPPTRPYIVEPALRQASPPASGRPLHPQSTSPLSCARWRRWPASCESCARRPDKRYPSPPDWPPTQSPIRTRPLRWGGTLPCTHPCSLCHSHAMPLANPTTSLLLPWTSRVQTSPPLNYTCPKLTPPALAQPLAASPATRAPNGHRGGVNCAPISLASPQLTMLPPCMRAYKKGRPTSCPPCHPPFFFTGKPCHHYPIFGRRCVPSPANLTASHPPCTGHRVPPCPGAALGPVGPPPSSPERRRIRVAPLRSPLR